MTISIVTQGAQPNYDETARLHAQKITNYENGRGPFTDEGYEKLDGTRKPTTPVKCEICCMNTTQIMNNNNVIITTFICTK